MSIPTGVLLEPRVVLGALDGEVEGDLQAMIGGGLYQPAEIIAAAQLWVNRFVAARLMLLHHELSGLLETEQVALFLHEDSAHLMTQADHRAYLSISTVYPIDVERTAALFASWYELFHAVPAFVGQRTPADQHGELIVTVGEHFAGNRNTLANHGLYGEFTAVDHRRGAFNGDPGQQQRLGQR